MHLPRFLRLLLILLALCWSGWFLVGAFQRWRYESISAMIAPVYIPKELMKHYRRTQDWQTPLMLACLPLLFPLTQWLLRLGHYLKKIVAAYGGKK
jgi:hypothetical protein